MTYTEVFTLEYINSWLNYDPTTGIFTWIKTSTTRIQIGDSAGSYSNGYLIISIKGVQCPAHRLAWLCFYGKWPDKHIDHINRIRDDNRIANLRDVTPAENSKNRSLNVNNKSGIMGVSWHKRECRWSASISVSNKTIHLGKFRVKNHAIRARKEAEEKYGYLTSK